MTKKTIFFLLIPLLSWAHGEDKPGPHGGHIRMPGAFHTELVLGKDGSAHIYLLDMNFKNPTTKDSQVTVTARDSKKTIKFKCSVMGGNHYHCVPQETVGNKMDLVVSAVREKAKANEAVYKLPLPPFADQTKPSENKESTHHHH